MRAGPAGNEIMGHEFHYARTLSVGDEPLVDCRDAGRGRARRRRAPRLGERHVLPRHQRETDMTAVAPAVRRDLPQDLPRPRAVAPRRAPLPHRSGAETLLDDLIELATHAPSVGLSQPWRFVKVKSPERRRAVWEELRQGQRAALAGYEGEQRANYCR
jgi:hypothetical protein